MVIIMVIQHNLSAMFSQRQLGITTGIKAKSSEKLSSGYRINRAADDAAGLAISEKMRRQIRGLSQNLDNVQDGVSFCQVADGYLNEVHDMIQRINELCVKASTDTLTSEDRQYIDMEVQETKNEIDRIFDTAEFNEMKIFKLPYTPGVRGNPEPYDTEIFYSSPGVIGGLEFNNIRYTLSELRNEGMQLDSNGRATADQEVEFSLYTGETVKLHLLEGQDLTSVRREYHWTADGNGILVNNVRAATWSGLGVPAAGNAAGNYSFGFHGMTIDFDVEDGDTLQDIIDGINGNGITPASYWDTAVSAGTGVNVVTYPSCNSITATNANASVFDHSFAITATNSGLAITDATTGNIMGGTTPWSSFSNVGGVVPRTPAEPDAASSGYPIVDFGISDYNNGAGGITFESEALYRYTNGSSMPFGYTFRLADVSSRDDIISAMNGTSLNGSIDCPANLTYGAASDGSSFSVSNTRITSGGNTAFGLQRAYGRNFDTNAAMTGHVDWTSSYVAGSETSHDLTYTNEYLTGSASAITGPTSYYYRDSDGNVWLRSNEVVTTTTENWRRDDRYEWTKDYDVTYTGDLNGHTMNSETVTQTIGFVQNDVTTWDRTVKTCSWDDNYMLSGTELDEVLAQEAAGTLNIQTKANADDSIDGSANTTSNTAVKDGSFTHSQNFYEDNPVDYAFTFRQSMSYSDIAGGANGSSNINITFSRAATRSFTPAASGRSVVDYSFNDITIYPPSKKLLIQATPDSPDLEQIPLEWSALNLGVIGLSGTNTLSSGSAKGGIDQAKNALYKISEERSKFGASQNRCEHAYKAIGIARENTQHSESLIRDTEMSDEAVKNANHSVLEQAGQAMLAQANQSKNGVLSLLQ